MICVSFFTTLQYTTPGGGAHNGNGSSGVYAAIPAELRSLKQFVCWSWGITKDGKKTKLPIEPATGEYAITIDPKTWGTFRQAVTAQLRDNCAGIGFVFSRKDPYVGVDLDNCRDKVTGAIAPWAQRFLDLLDGGYAEVSPSGTGVHIIVCGELPAGGHKRRYETGAVEMYSWGRFFTMTGQVIP